MSDRNIPRLDRQVAILDNFSRAVMEYGGSGSEGGWAKYQEIRLQTIEALYDSVIEPLLKDISLNRELFAVETFRVSVLVRAAKDDGHSGAEDWQHIRGKYCGLCRALNEIGAIE